MCAAKRVEIVGVTKGFTAIPEIAQVMVDGGIKGKWGQGLFSDYNFTLTSVF